MENLPQPLYTFKCRKVITHEWPCINVLSVGTSSYFNQRQSGVMMGKLNQQKICTWEMEYQHQLL